ncbi:carbamoyltransferase HypF, partial [Candidatus Fermentibacteria bacterium]
MARITEAAGLTGWVRNQSGTVRLVLEGPVEVVDRFMKRLESELPPRASLEGVHVLSREFVKPSQVSEMFTILDSASDRSMRISIPADLAICPQCMKEVLSPSSRFYRYPFTTCTDCGPRYTVVETMPYDRERTALRDFPLCSKCMEEYTDPGNRRFHAESIACPVCGPELAWRGQEGNLISAEDPLEEARKAISEGAVVAVKGLGGFLLVADASNREVLKKLRKRKNRPAKPFAVMASNLSVLKKQCLVSAEEEELLSSPEAPIVVLRTADNPSLPLDLLAPGLNNLGVMLPTTPLHLLLAESTGDDSTGSFDFLLMTSGNRGGEPVCTSNEEALTRLKGIADFFLLHNRRINLRNDDSLAVVNHSGVQIWRRARGYAPNAVSLSFPLKKTVLAMGAELKNTICLGFDNEAVLSPHTGDLETPEALDGLEQVVKNFPEYFGKAPDTIVTDLHPDMHSTRLGMRLAAELGVPLLQVQHHYAHALAIMCEHRLKEAVALVFDGTGLGTDGTIWGGELLHVRETEWTRLGTLAPAILPGGDAAVLRPAIQLIARFWQQGLAVDKRWQRRLGVTSEELRLWKTQFERRINCYTTHAAG